QRKTAYEVETYWSSGVCSSDLGDEIVRHAAAERPGPIERVQRDQIVERLRLRLAQDVAHAAALELEDAVGLRILEDLIRPGIVRSEERRVGEAGIVRSWASR